MKPYSMDLRKRVLADYDAGQPTKQVAKKYGVSGTWVRTLKRRRRETGEIAVPPIYSVLLATTALTRFTYERRLKSAAPGGLPKVG